MPSQFLFHKLEVILQWEFVILAPYRQLEDHNFSVIRDYLLNINLYKSRVHHRQRTQLTIAERAWN
jgi:hypothetical protein